ncbi:MAG: GYD domain-containing protein [Azospirillaceae bacterium]
MTIYITQGRFSQKAIEGFVAKPEDRRDAVAKLMEAAGGRLIDYYVTFGDYDFLIISEGHDNKDVVASLLTAAASGTVSELKTTVAMTTADAKSAMEKAKSIAGSFRAPGT